MRRIGIDVGGTFTDVVLLDAADGGVWTAKVMTTPEDPVRGALNGIRQVIAQSRTRAEEVEFVGHGTTIATNLIVEGKGAPTALVTTEGFRDILEIRRSSRHDRADLYDLHFDNPPPLVPRRFRFEAAERVLHDGRIEKPLTEEEIDRLIAALGEAPIKAVAVCFLNSHIEPRHERAFIEKLRRRLPALFASASFEVNPEIFEYERTSTTIINAVLGPKCGDYIREFAKNIQGEGIPGRVLFMQSNGGLTSPAVIASKPIALLESGPAGGVTASLALCRQLGVANAILGDVGGTTFDVSLIRDGQPEMRTSSLIQTYTVRSPTIDIESVGAGGGSIAWVDEAGGLHVGPQSAGAAPGPACYGRGGIAATVTDCNVLLGYIDVESFPGEIRLDLDAAERVVADNVAKPLQCTTIEAAAVVRAVANANMAQAIRLMTVQRGFDPREFAYVCFGGAGPVHAADLARELEIPKIIVPPLPGLFSAVGMLVADESHEVQSPVGKPLSEVSLADIEARYSALETEARALFADRMAAIAVKRRIDCRYLSQAEAMTVELPERIGNLAADLRAAFEAVHKRHWNFVRPELPVVLVNVRLWAHARTGAEVQVPPPSSGNAAAPYRSRRLHVAGKWIEVPAYRRQDIRLGDTLIGPGIVEEASSSLFFEDGDRVAAHPSGALEITRRI